MTKFVSPHAPTQTPLGNVVIITLFDGIKVEINGATHATYDVSFIDADNNMVIYQLEMSTGNWASPLMKYYVKWKVVIKENGVEILNQVLELKNMKVWISLDSKALGDTIAWVPYAEEFRKRHNCEVHISTFHNNMFKDAYDALIFEEPGSAVPFTYAYYVVGCFDNNYNRNKNNWRIITLQQVASDILGLKFKEVKPVIKRSTSSRPIEDKYVVITEFSTLQCKFWNHPGGWQEIVDYLVSIGFRVMSVSKESTSLKNVIKMNGKSLDETIRNIQHAEFMISIGSGLCWLSWALDIPTIVISGFSKPISEMSDCYRVFNPRVCNGCYNNPDFPFDRGNWNWCPLGNKFECSVAITPKMVKETIQNLITDNDKSKKYDMVKTNGMNVSVRDGEMQKDDLHVINIVINNDAYKLDKLKYFIDAPKVIMDIGGHIGTFCMKAKSVWPDASVIGYEPSAQSYDLYGRNIQNNQLSGCTVHNRAVSYDKGRTLLVEDNESSGGGILISEKEMDENGKLHIDYLRTFAEYHVSENGIQVVDLEEAISDNGIEYIDLLKMDCEGSEVSIIRNMSQETARKIGVIVGEFHYQEGFDAFAELVKSKFPEYDVIPLKPPFPHIGEFMAGPKPLIDAFSGKHKIKLVHLLSNPDSITEKRSIASLSRVADFGVEYVQHVNGYETSLPSDEPMYPTGQWGQPLKPGYWGVWKANRRAVEEEFSQDIDMLVICERDAVLSVAIEDFVSKLRGCLYTSMAENIDYLSFGYKESPYTGILQSWETGVVNTEMYLTDHIIGLHCIAFPSRSREFLLDKFKTEKWYAADIWYNVIFNDAGKRMAITRERCVNQEDDGVSVIDGARTGADASQKPQPFEVPVHWEQPKLRVMMLCPHLSTGGMPEYAYQCVDRLINNSYAVRVVEWENIAYSYIVQKNKISSLVPIHTLGNDKRRDLESMIDDFKPDVIHLQEIPEMWMPRDIASWVYRQDRQYKIVETSHSSDFHPEAKEFIPDGFVLVNEYHLPGCRALGVPCEISEYETQTKKRPDRVKALQRLGLDPSKTHILNVGLFAPWKNQSEVFAIARRMPDFEFHFVGNQAPNFESYWGPILHDRPSNCTIWGERDDVDVFYAAMDLLLFSSTKEMYPIVIKEALSWQMPVMMRNMPTYCGAYDNRSGVTFIDSDIDETIGKIRRMFPSMIGGLSMMYSKITHKTSDGQKIGIVIPSRFDDHLSRVLDSIFKSQPGWQDICEIVVGDDGITEDCRNKYSQLGVTFLPMTKPFNFARNVNSCVRVLKNSDIIVLLNDDIMIDTPDFARVLRGVFSSLGRDHKNREYAAVGLAISKGGCANEEQCMSSFAEFGMSIQSAGFLVFIAVAMTMDTWERVGGLEEAFEGYGCEDIDWCRRADQMNYGFAVTNLISVTHGFDDGHAASCSFSRVFGQPNVYPLWEKSKDAYVKKWGDYDWWGNK